SCREYLKSGCPVVPSFILIYSPALAAQLTATAVKLLLPTTVSGRLSSMTVAASFVRPAGFPPAVVPQGRKIIAAFFLQNIRAGSAKVARSSPAGRHIVRIPW